MPYDYPSGKKLIQNIINDIENDEIFVVAAQYNKRQKSFELNLLKDSNFFKVKDMCVFDLFAQKSENSECFFLRGINGISPSYVKVSLKAIPELQQLQEKLRDFAPVSIDAFLRDNPDYAEAGQTMIIYNLLKCENPESFSLQNKEDNWYPHLLNDMYAELTEATDVLKNDLTIITFNYDNSLDYYLKNHILNTQITKKSSSKILIHKSQLSTFTVNYIISMSQMCILMAIYQANRKLVIEMAT